MWEPNEQLLLRAPTRYKKNEGTLFVTPRRVAWQQQGTPQLNPSLLYSDMGTLSQTPDTSPKVLLKISVTAPKPKDYTFHFISPKALTEREAVKSQVAELLSRVRGSSRGSTPALTPMTAATASPTPTPATATGSPAAATASSSAVGSPAPTPAGSAAATPGSPHSWRQEEFNARKHLLSSSRELHTLHMELVVHDRSVNEEEFWASPYVKRIRQKLNKESVSKEGRQKGKSSKMVELMPGQQEGSDVKYTLTSQIIHNIFTEFPSVKRAYDTNVPDKVTEQQFWKRFLASEFFHRSRTGARSQMAPYDDIFDRCLQEEDEENSKAPQISRIDQIKRAIDLTATEEDHIDSGNAPDFTMKPGGSAQVLPLIRRFNRHAMRVLETSPSSKKRDIKASDNDDIEREIIITDLQDENPPEKIVLDIEDSRRYFESQSGKRQDISISEEDAKHLLDDFKEDFQGWQPDLNKSVMEPRAANNAYSTLTEYIKRKVQHDRKISASDAKLPPMIQQKVQSYHSATNEILRHFWSSFEPYRADKNIRMAESLKKQKEKLKEVLTTVNRYEGDVERCRKMLQPVIDAVDKALEASQKRGKKRKAM
ncbi:hypothetical protein BDB00DRAFT_794531 [Zychaea mexicana]|uniref:uncharacterized protein n=1 Tax=Zychaea mexicana TaxID=64656 RepID=UPI0022FDF5F0|nr:uncharacterized protein BDB00DRAFT_794531 [Zychaea mexicana]KAI9499574.1 hypothetical protein BDB00DRAFT_794531 [Zychaea mexicana]